ncbi:hypothetical protein N9335_02525 [Crocinitomicaceae bacterium]|nr:hypothetical protein [Crocinitomicaceae bacterium]
MKLNCLVSLIICVFIIYSCEGNNDKEVIKYEDIGVRENDNTNNDSKPTDSIQSMDSTFNVANLEMKIDKVIDVTTSEFLDRFESSELQKKLIITSNDSIYFKTWTFEDSTDTFNAFYNLLDCFGINCIAIDLYSTVLISPTYNLLFISKNKIHWVASNNNQDMLVWDSYLKSEFQIPFYYFVIEQKTNQNIVWLEENNYRPNTFKVLNSNL